MLVKYVNDMACILENAKNNRDVLWTTKDVAIQTP